MADPPTPPSPGESRRLAQAPSARYAQPTASPSAAEPRRGSALPGPLARAILVAVAGAISLVLLGAVLASTFGLLFAAGIAGAAIGLVLARAAAPGDDARVPVRRRTVAWLSIGLAVAAVVAAALGTWVVARAEGGTLGLVDYLLTTFGAIVPAEAVIAAIAASWGAGAGPVQR